MMRVIKVNGAAIDLSKVIAVSDIKIQEFKFNNSKTQYFEIYFVSGSMLTLTDKSSKERIHFEHSKLVDAFEEYINEAKEIEQWKSYTES